MYTAGSYHLYPQIRKSLVYNLVNSFASNRGKVSEGAFAAGRARGDEDLGSWLSSHDHVPSSIIPISRYGMQAAYRE